MCYFYTFLNIFLCIIISFSSTLDAMKRNREERVEDPRSTKIPKINEVKEEYSAPSLSFFASKKLFESTDFETSSHGLKFMIEILSVRNDFEALIQKTTLNEVAINNIIKMYAFFMQDNDFDSAKKILLGFAAGIKKLDLKELKDLFGYLEDESPFKMMVRFCYTGKSGPAFENLDDFACAKLFANRRSWKRQNFTFDANDFYGGFPRPFPSEQLLSDQLNEYDFFYPKNLPNTLLSLLLCPSKITLMSLSCFEIKIKQLPSEIGFLSDLLTTNLKLANHELTDLPETFALLKNLQYLDLSKNNFMQIPEVIAELKNLEILNVLENPINELPSWLGDMPKLKEVIVSPKAIVSNNLVEKGIKTWSPTTSGECIWRVHW